MTEFVYEASALVPKKAADILDILDVEIPLSVYIEGEMARVSVFGYHSADEALDKLWKILQILRESVDLIKVKDFSLEKVKPEIKKLKPEDFEFAYKKYLKPVNILNKLLIVPKASDCEMEAESDLPVIFLDSLLAFGTGSHPTTKMCLDYIVGADLKGKTVIDAGTGSGILALAAAKMGAEKVIAFDNDQVAVGVALANVKLNGLEDRIQVIESGLEILGELEADIVVANLTSEIILDNFPSFLSSRAKKIALSGFLTADEDRIIKRFNRSFCLVSRKESSGWVMLEFAHE